MNQMAEAGVCWHPIRLARVVTPSNLSGLLLFRVQDMNSTCSGSKCLNESDSDLFLYSSSICLR